MKRFRLTFYLSDGRDVSTAEEIDATLLDEFGDVHDFIEESIEDRESPWKTFGDLTIHFKDIRGWRAEEYQVREVFPPTQKGTAT